MSIRPEPGIYSFSGVYRFLSNFYPALVKLDDGETYPTVEHAFQAAKTLDRNYRMQIRLAPSPGVAKRLGRLAVLRDHWDDVKISIMLDLLRQKFSTPTLKAMLIRTAPFLLTEGNDWGDTFWGVCRGVGENHLGKLLMMVRYELIAKGD